MAIEFQVSDSFSSGRRLARGHRQVALRPVFRPRYTLSNRQAGKPTSRPAPTTSESEASCTTTVCD